VGSADAATVRSQARPQLTVKDGTRQWRLNGELHRADGPAIEYPDGTRAWWLNDVELSEAEHAAAVARLADERAAAAAAEVAVRPGRRGRISALAG
jgi:hypothetical protein